MHYKIVKRPIISLVFYAGLFLLPIIFWPWAPIPYEIPKVWFFQKWVEILGVLGVAALLLPRFHSGFGRVRGIKEKSNSKGNLLIVILVGVFVLASIVSSLLGADWQKSIWGNYYRGDGLITLFCLAGLFYFLVLYWNKDWEKPTACAIAGGSIIVSFWTIILVALRAAGMAGITGGSFFGNAVGGTFGNPNFLAGYLLVSLPFTVFFLRNGKGKIRLMSLICLISQIIAIILTQSRGAIAGTFLLGVMYFWERLGKLGRLGILIGLGILIIFGATKLKKELKVSEGMYFYPESRGRIVVRGYQAFKQKPVFGWGTANFDYAFEAINWPIKVYKDVYVDKAHSSFLEILVCGGIVGFVVYVGIIILVFKELIKKRVNKKEQNDWKITLILVFVIFIFSSQTNVVSINEELIFWLIAGITAAGG